MCHASSCLCTEKKKKNTVDIPPHQSCYSWPTESILTPGLDPQLTAVLPHQNSHLLYAPHRQTGKNHNFEYKHAGVSTQTGFQLKPTYVSRHLNRIKSHGLGQAITASCQVHLKNFLLRRKYQLTEDKCKPEIRWHLVNLNVVSLHNEPKFCFPKGFVLCEIDSANVFIQ